MKEKMAGESITVKQMFTGRDPTQVAGLRARIGNLSIITQTEKQSNLESTKLCEKLFKTGVHSWWRHVWRGAKQKGPRIAVFCVLGTQLWMPVGNSCFSMLWCVAKANGPLNILFFNNGYPNDGSQLFLSWNDGVDSWNMNSSALQPSGTIYGTPDDWVAGQWHHVAVSWDAATVGFYLDGGLYT